MTLNPVDRRARRGELLRWAGWFAMTNAVVMILIALRYLEVGDLSGVAAGRVFGIAMFAAHASSMAIVLLLPVFVLALLWPQRHLVTPLALAIAVATTLVLFVDTLVYQQYRFHLNSAVLAMFFSSASDEIFEFSLATKLLLALIALLVIVGQWWLARLVWRFVARSPRRYFGYPLAAALVLLFLGTNLFYAYADAVGNFAVTRQTRLLPLYEPLTAKDFLREHGFDVVTTARADIEAVGGSFDYPRLPLQTHKPDHRPNILFLVLESWRFDALSDKVTPHIAAFAENNLRFLRHRSGGNATRVGIFTLFYGIPGTYWQSALQTGTRAALVQRLDRLGYHFALYPSAPLYSPEFNRTVFAGMTGLRLTSEGDSSPARDIDANQDFIRFLQQRGPHAKPFFGFLFYDSPHAYDVPDGAPMPFQPSWDAVNYLALGDAVRPPGFVNLYKNTVHFVDTLVGKVLDTLRAQGLMDDTIIFVTGDHGQEFNDLGLGYWGHNSNYARYQTHVPLVVHWPGKGAENITYLTSHLDIAPTLMKRALGVENAFAATSVGHDLFDPGGRLPILMAKYRGYAAYTGEGYVVFPPFGGIDVRDKNYRLIEGASPPPGIIRAVLKQLSRFRGG